MSPSRKPEVTGIGGARRQASRINHVQTVYQPGINAAPLMKQRIEV